MKEAVSKQHGCADHLTYLFDNPSTTCASESLDRVVLPLLHLGFIPLRPVHLDDRDRLAGNTVLAAVDRVRGNRVTVEVADGFHYSVKI